MNGYLIDTNIIAHSAPNKPHSSKLLAWLEAHSHELYLSVITLAEIENGIAKLHRQGATNRAKLLEQWLVAIVQLYDKRILPLNQITARETGKIIDLSISKGMNIGFADCAIAATAKTHSLILLTHNTRHFEQLGIQLFMPEL